MTTHELMKLVKNGLDPNYDPEMLYYGIGEEVGEVLGICKRKHRMYERDIPMVSREHLVEELGDVLWYLVAICIHENIDLDHVIDYNTKKLEARYNMDIKQYENGGVREQTPGKGIYNSMSMVGLKRLAQRYEYGEVKYGNSDNYKKGIPVSRCFDSTMRHMVAYLSGDNSEDHLAAAAWNIFCMMEMEVNNPEWNDIKSRQGLKCTDYSMEEIK